MSNEHPPLTREALPGFLAQYEGKNHLEGWAELWRRGDCLPWDRGFPNPALEDTLTQQQALLGGPLLEESAATAAGAETSAQRPRRKKALVPGCGRGVDVLLLASFGYDAYGLEYSPGAVEACRQEEIRTRHGDEYPVRDEKIGRGMVTWIQGDFFSDDWLVGLKVPQNRFDLIYDYTVNESLLSSVLVLLTLRLYWVSQLRRSCFFSLGSHCSYFRGRLIVVLLCLGSSPATKVGCTPR